MKLMVQTMQTARASTVTEGIVTSTTCRNKPILSQIRQTSRESPSNMKETQSMVRRFNNENLSLRKCRIRRVG